MGLGFPIFPRCFAWMNAAFCQVLFQHLMKWPCFFLWVVYEVEYIDGFLYIEPYLHPWYEAYLTVINDNLMCSWNWLARTLLSIWSSTFIRKLFWSSLSFLDLCVALVLVGLLLCRMSWVVFLLYVFCGIHFLKNIDVRSLKVWYNSPLKPSGLVLFFGWKTINDHFYFFKGYGTV